jgi:hypothetical protein
VSPLRSAAAALQILNMDLLELRTKLAGVIAFPITPFKDDLSLDPEGLRDNLERIFQYAITCENL